MKRRLSQLVAWLSDRAALATAPRGRRVALVSDRRGWSIDVDRRHLLRQLKELGCLSVRKLIDPTHAQHCLVHVLNRYSLLRRVPDSVAASNRVVMTWYHGAPEDEAFDRWYAALGQWMGRLEAVVTSCRTSAEDLSRGGVAESKIKMVPLGVDLDTFGPPTPAQRKAARAAWGVGRGEIAIGSFQKDGAGWGEGMQPKRVKGPDVFLEAIAALRRAEPGLKLKVLLTGTARAYVCSGLTRLGVPYVHRWLNKHSDIAEAYHALDLYMVASRCEGGPKAILESGACGVPLVTTRVGMARDLIEHGRHGMVADIEDAAALADHCRTLIHDPALRQACVEQAMAQASRYTWRHAAVNLYQQVYAPILNRESGPGVGAP